MFLSLFVFHYTSRLYALQLFQIYNKNEICEERIAATAIALRKKKRHKDYKCLLRSSTNIMEYETYRGSYSQRRNSGIGR
jgi:hypothetical protein